MVKDVKGIVVSDGIGIVLVYLLVDLDLFYDKVKVDDMVVEYVWVEKVF